MKITPTNMITFTKKSGQKPKTRFELKLKQDTPPKDTLIHKMLIFKNNFEI